MSTWTTIARGIALAGAGALALAASFDPVGAWPLILVGFVPIGIAQHRVLPREWAGLATAIGYGGYIASVTWGGFTASQRPWLLLVAAGLFVSGWLERGWHQRTGYRHLWWSGPVTWAGALFAFGLTPLSSWIDPAYALYRQYWLLQPVSVFAITGANLMILGTNFAVLAAVLNRTQRLRLVAGAAVGLSGWVVLSGVLLDVGSTDRIVRVAAVQPGAIPRVDRLPAGQRAAADARILDVLEAGTRQAARDGAELVVWPEKALQYDDPALDAADRLRALAAETHVYLVIGYTQDPQRFNRATVLAPTGRFLGVYDKQHPVLFAGDHSVGGPVVVMKTDLGTIAPIICFDLDFADTGREAARKGADLLVVPSEDWSGIARQHYTHLVFRAIENRVSAVKADTAWGSAIIDANGRILARHVTTDPSSVVLVRDVALGTGRSPLVSTGDWIGWACLGLSVLWGVIVLRGRATRGKA